MSLVFDKREKNKPGTHVFVIGVGSYPYFPGSSVEKPVGQVEMSARSAFGIARWFIQHHNYPDAPLQSVRLLLSGNQTRTEAAEYFHCKIESAMVEDVDRAFWDWQDDLNAVDNSIAVFYFAGHGIGNAAGQSLLMEDYHQNHRAPLDGAVNYVNLLQSVNQSTSIAGAWFFVDACRQADLEQVARDRWGKELDGNVPLLAGPVLSFQLYAAGDGEEALGQVNGMTFFASALIDALDKNGYAYTGDGWAILPSRLQDAVDANLKLACEIASIPESKVPYVEGRNPDSNLELHQRGEDNPPKFLVKITCRPEVQNTQFTLSYGLTGAADRVERPPEAVAWYIHLAPGLYSFEAKNEERGETRKKDQNVEQHLVRVFLKGAV